MNKFKISENILTIGLRGIDDFEVIKNSLMIDELLFMSQIHSSDIYDARNEEDLSLLISNPPKVDGIVIKRDVLKKVGLVVKTADCLPIFVIGSNYCTAIHAGWKGLVLGIHLKILDFYSKSELSKIKVIIGPHAIYDYEVKHDVLDQFHSPVYTKKNGRTYLNMQEILYTDLVSIGVSGSNICKSNLCTISNTGFYSYRRNKLEKMRNFNIITLK